MFPGRADPIRRGGATLAAWAIFCASVACATSLAAASGPAPERIPVVLPTLPSPSVRFPGLFDESGCALLSGTGGQRTRVCPAPPQPSADVAADGARRLLGYEGPHYATSVTGSGVEILPATIGVSPNGNWKALGMVRNETRWTVGVIEVTATLERRDGTPLETVRATVPVRDVRPGEPAPFALSSTTSRASVALVRWATSYRRAPSPSASSRRMIEISLVRALSDAHERGLLDESDAAASSGDGPQRSSVAVAWGTLRSWSESPIRRPAVVAMWLDADGRALALGSARVWESIARRVRAPVALAPGSLAEFTLSIPDLVAGRSVKPTMALWGTPS